MRHKPKLTCIIPIRKEAALLSSCLSHVCALDDEMQIIVADAGGDKATVEIVRSFQPRVEFCSASGGRHEQLNQALRIAQGDVICCLAVDMRIQSACLDAIRSACGEGFVYGCLYQRSTDWRLHFRVQDFIARMRARWCCSAYMDQVPFYQRRALLVIDGFRNRHSYDTADACRRIGQPQAFICINRSALSSCRSWRARGFWRQVFTHQRPRLRYLLGTILSDQS